MASNTYDAVETRIQLALASIADETKPNIAKLAREFEVPETRLRYRFRGGGSLKTCGGTNKALTAAEELALCQAIDREEADGTFLRHWQVQHLANWILAQSCSPEAEEIPTVSIPWVGRFLKRHPQYKIRTSKPLAAARKWSHDPQRLRQWYERWQQATERYGIQTADIYNYDETGFRVGCGGKQTVVTRFHHQRLFHSDTDDREHITSVETICADGYSLPPFVVLQGKLHTHRLYFEEGFSGDTAVALNETGYMNEELNIQYLNHFNKYTSKRRVGRWRMLIFDGFNSHTAERFIQQCWSSHIVPWALPPHATHLLQPLDVVCFQPLKHYHRKAIDSALRVGIFNFNRLEFIAAFQDMRKQAFKPSTICSSFEATGLIPFDPDKVVKPLEERQRREQSEEIEDIISTCSTNSTWPTPQKPSDFKWFAEYLEDHINIDQPQAKRRFDRFLKGAVAKSISGLEAEKLLRDHKKAAAASVQRQEGSRKVIARGGVLYADDAAEAIRSRRIHDVEVAEDHVRAQNLPRGQRGKFKRAQAKTRELERLRQFEHPDRDSKRLKRAQSV
jgi:DDE superfamily endonuclease